MNGVVSLSICQSECVLCSSDTPPKKPFFNRPATGVLQLAASAVFKSSVEPTRPYPLILDEDLIIQASR